MDFTRKQLQEIADILEKNNYSTYTILTVIVNSMATAYNLNEEEIQKQLDLILKAIKKY